MNSVAYHDNVHVKLGYPIVTTAAQVALAYTLPVDGVDFLLMLQRLWQYPRVFGKALGQTTWVVQYIDAGNAAPVKLSPYQAILVRWKVL